MTVLGNLFLAVAVLLYAVPLPMVIVAPRTHDGGQSEAWALILLLLALWFCLFLALCASTANGGLDWLAATRGRRIAILATACLAMAVVTGLSGLLRREPWDQVPWMMHPLAPAAWAMWVFPPVVMIFCLATLNPSIGAGVSPRVLRTAVGTVGGLSLIASLGLLGQWFVSSQQQEAARVDAIVSRGNEITRQRLEEAHSMDAASEFSRILGYTNRYDDAKVREAALQKIRALPDLEDRLAAGLRGPECEEVLIFLDASDPPDNRPLAEPARDAFATLAEQAHTRTRDANDTLHPDSFSFDVRLILSVADKFRGLGVDYAPAIRAYRAALDEPREQKVKFDSAATLDDWLARDAKRRK